MSQSLFQTIGRVLGFSLERNWIDYIGFLMDRHLPKLEQRDWAGQLLHVVYFSWILLGVMDVFRVLGVKQERGRNEYEEQLLLLKRQ